MRDKNVLEVRRQVNPTQAIQEIRPRVWMLARVHAIMAATATYTAVQVACEDTALRPMEMLNIPEPVTNVHPIGYQHM